MSVKFNQFKATDNTTIIADPILRSDNVIKTVNGLNVIGIKELGATATATVAKVTLLGVSPSSIHEVVVKDEFKVKLAKQFEGAKLVYFNDGVNDG